MCLKLSNSWEQARSIHDWAYCLTHGRSLLSWCSLNTKLVQCSLSVLHSLLKKILVPSYKWSISRRVISTSPDFAVPVSIQLESLFTTLPIIQNSRIWTLSPSKRSCNCMNTIKLSLLNKPGRQSQWKSFHQGILFRVFEIFCQCETFKGLFTTCFSWPH